MPTTTPIYNFNDVWTNGLTNACIKAVITDTSSAADSTMVDLEVTGKGSFTVDKNGNLEVSGLLTGLAVYGAMYANGNSTAEPTVDATPRNIEAWNTDGLVNGVVVDSTTDNDITVPSAGIYEVQASISFNGTLSRTFLITIYKNGSSTDLTMERKLGTGGDVGSCSLVGLIQCAASDVIELYQSSSDGGTDMTVREAQLVVKKISAGP
jgi:hypothetical protein